MKVFNPVTVPFVDPTCNFGWTADGCLIGKSLASSAKEALVVVTFKKNAKGGTDLWAENFSSDERPSEDGRFLFLHEYQRGAVDPKIVAALRVYLDEIFQAKLSFDGKKLAVAFFDEDSVLVFDVIAEQ